MKAIFVAPAAEVELHLPGDEGPAQGLPSLRHDRPQEGFQVLGPRQPGKQDVQRLRQFQTGRADEIAEKTVDRLHHQPFLDDAPRDQRHGYLFQDIPADPFQVPLLEPVADVGHDR